MSDDLTLAIQRFDLKAYVQERGGQRASGVEWLLLCPHCGKNKVSVNVRERRFRCFVCEEYGLGFRGKRVAIKGAGGVFALVRWLDGLGPREAADFLLDRGAPRYADLADLPEIPTPDDVDDGARSPTGIPDGVVAIDGTLPYMQRRGISLADARSFGLLWVPPGTSWLQNRILFPVWHRGQCLYWQARACWDKEEHERWWPGTRFKKTLNPAVYFCRRCGEFPEPAARCPFCGTPKQFGAADAVLNLEQAARYPRVAICEGPTSAIRAGPSAVATFGKVLHPQQIAQLLAAGVRAVDFMWDGPTPREPHGAWPEMIRAAAQLSGFLDVRLVFIPQGDPGDHPREHLDYWRSIARPASDFDGGLL